MAEPGILASLTITAFLVIVLARALWHKLDRHLETVGFAQGYGLVPATWTGPIVRALSVAEGVIILSLFIPATRREGGAMAAALFAGYGLLMAAALLGGRRRIDCGCGGAPQIVSAFTLGRNAVLTALGLAVAILPATSAPPTGAFVAITGALVLAAIHGVIEKLASHLPYSRREEG
ncbi:MauE/DoxX family redox-associated membrane protein [Amaricoccus solimangrovi]|uniref:Methylamine utilization protein MauE n=1 Tax=Amaricoccus solimangrovi TaxID=2589815 RepID=A0A501X037_9RHOB|nr:MauE/DoxX family redox-associated membrane protein [Amaricoccus solimangrovi]TPE51896.1 hypothetical protein FJM51_07665 [Amaricoccus solimangrovi]